ncbi:MAG TPA: UbiD family decarboxylase [Dehalococcoidia bacterium]|nr:UbiD family decarboxylase [Dehalococcoidia bacterium]
MPWQDLREFIAKVEEIGELKRIDGADWDLEIGALTEVAASMPKAPLLLCDNIKGYPQGYRVASTIQHSLNRTALILDLPMDMPSSERGRVLREKLRNIKPVSPVEVKDAPVKENILLGEDVDLFRFPIPRWHELDKGRYIGTADMIIMRDPDTGVVQIGTYRVQAHNRNRAGSFIEPGKHGDLIRQKYWERGQSCPVAICVGQDPLLFAMASSPAPIEYSEYEIAGYLRGKPIEVTRGEVTGLPIPAAAEIVLEGEIPPPSEEVHPEGPFGEWTGYYASGERDEPVIRVKAILHRNDPIITGSSPLKVEIPGGGLGLLYAAFEWLSLERSGVTDLVGFMQYGAAMAVIAVKQRYAGHGKRAAMAYLQNYRGASVRFAVAVDDDINVHDPRAVIWAIGTRCDPATALDVIQHLPASALDTRLSPEEREQGTSTVARAVIDACRPFEWRDQFPPVNVLSAKTREATIQKWGKTLGL